MPALSSTIEPRPLVGAFARGALDAPRAVVRWVDAYHDHHQLAPHVDPRMPAYLSVYAFPSVEYCTHFVRAGNSPRGYSGPAACRHLPFDIDRPGNLEIALADARRLMTHLLSRYGTAFEAGIAAYFTGSKGFCLTMELLPAFSPAPSVPVICRRLAQRIATDASVEIDTSIYHHQSALRLANSRHPKTGLHRRPLTKHELLTLSIEEICDLARQPVRAAVPACAGLVPRLESDWNDASTEPAPACSALPNEYSIVPKFVRDFIGFADVQATGRAVTLFRCAASLGESFEEHGMDAVIAGLLEESALKSGLPSEEVRRQIECGIAHGTRKGSAR